MQLTKEATSATVYETLVTNLYRAVDAMDAPKVTSFVSENVIFRLGNFDMLTGRGVFEDANAGFFTTITAMHHTISGIWTCGDTVFCEGRVHYTRKNGTTHEVPFSTRLKFDHGLICEYIVFVDISGL
ncbi:SnoaL-like domain protein [Pseudovibrio axinellae]|uniref:SnoaL-like domain protein n=1 Tax=Pseudovibrio axinellae TaxID=989403 RepID=A0A165YZM0_9HYPH|nr:nuclear transport factor 2 family protein [Pseudovibrio axinellae]KZL19377.1 SnoaL-like domain protein [Pseudovibrio axinellae]SEQ38990.1 SnoaL-like domain-containing protein [Pseudovibrio axinellae]